MNNLSQSKCVPCRGNTPTVPEENILEYMKVLVGWERKNNAILKTFVFSNFKEALVFFNKVAGVAEEEDHHPDMSIHAYKNVTLSFTTHAVNDLTENDFIMAAKIDEIQ